MDFIAGIHHSIGADGRGVGQVATADIGTSSKGSVTTSGRVGRKRIITACDIIISGRVGKKRTTTACLVTVSGRVGMKRIITACSVFVSGRVEIKRTITACSVFVSGRVGTKRIITACSVFVSGRVGIKRIITACSVFVSGRVGIKCPPRKWSNSSPPISWTDGEARSLVPHRGPGFSYSGPPKPNSYAGPAHFLPIKQ